jgi:hypothetical protein
MYAPLPLPFPPRHGQHLNTEAGVARAYWAGGSSHPLDELLPKSLVQGRIKEAVAPTLPATIVMPDVDHSPSKPADSTDVAAGLRATLTQPVLDKAASAIELAQSVISQYQRGQPPLSPAPAPEPELLPPPPLTISEITSELGPKPPSPQGSFEAPLHERSPQTVAMVQVPAHKVAATVHPIRQQAWDTQRSVTTPNRDAKLTQWIEEWCYRNGLSGHGSVVMSGLKRAQIDHAEWVLTLRCLRGEELEDFIAAAKHAHTSAKQRHTVSNGRAAPAEHNGLNNQAYYYASGSATPKERQRLTSASSSYLTSTPSPSSSGYAAQGSSSSKRRIPRRQTISYETANNSARLSSLYDRAVAASPSAYASSRDRRPLSASKLRAPNYPSARNANGSKSPARSAWGSPRQPTTWTREQPESPLRLAKRQAAAAMAAQYSPRPVSRRQMDAAFARLSSPLRSPEYDAVYGRGRHSRSPSPTKQRYPSHDPGLARPESPPTWGTRGRTSPSTYRPQNSMQFAGGRRDQPAPARPLWFAEGIEKGKRVWVEDRESPYAGMFGVVQEVHSQHTSLSVYRYRSATLCLRPYAHNTSVQLPMAAKVLHLTALPWIRRSPSPPPRFSWTSNATTTGHEW